jgi:lariat debranching enzyme
MDEDFDAPPSAPAPTPVPHPTAAAPATTTTTNANPDEISLEDDDELMADVAPPLPPQPTSAPDGAGDGESGGGMVRVIDGKRMKRRETKFLALDKCLPRRRFLEVRR